MRLINLGPEELVRAWASSCPTCRAGSGLRCHAPDLPDQPLPGAVHLARWALVPTRQRPPLRGFGGALLALPLLFAFRSLP